MMDILDKKKNDLKMEREEGFMTKNDLEGQIADLTANLKIMRQIKNNGELSQASIFGTSGLEKKRGKKKVRKKRTK
eukprot:CAMPEP_0172508968 /NCGR_PEP_ID=MMETSP1066-20121228/216506_1 /TAXON_ID=671091 /ORGANISM="Coscinodiscus wailesii, Strain CCMP2513" /LENGTH=75 /DNA_ID=CAMNT_0013287229 /DNA_START=213 /DNA_END=440 /DNA_ORIENTATION=-